MAAPLTTAKQTVALGSGEVRVSRIRRDPPPVEKQTVVLSRNERDRRTVLLGIALSAFLALVLLAGFASYSGWSPRQVTIEVPD
ncbi:MAG TPA: hypothetical protein VFO42_03305 [Sphingomicrobium sp.]|nr:hypothetical protein [Sphingomicrobium sp.]